MSEEIIENPAFFEKLSEIYDLDECREIRDHGCALGLCHKHIHFSQTNEFFDEHEDEVIGYLMRKQGEEYPGQLFIENEYNIVCYKNDMVWCLIECWAAERLKVSNKSRSSS